MPFQFIEETFSIEAILLGIVIVICIFFYEKRNVSDNE